MSNLILILGQSGSGKSTAIRTLPAENTLIINVLQKQLPFKGSAKHYNAEKGNLFVPEPKNAYGSTLARLQATANEPNVKYIVIDDATYFMRHENFATCTQSGYARFTTMAKNFQTLLFTCQHLRNDIIVFFIMHAEEVVSDGSVVAFQPATCGTLIKREYNPQECVSIALYAYTTYNDKGQAEYMFVTNRTCVGTAELPAKSPAEMFPITIPNDLKVVADYIEKYFNE